MDKKMQILLFERDENLGMLLQEYLQNNDFAVDLLFDPEKVLLSFEKNKHDICILSVSSGSQEGLRLGEKIKTFPLNNTSVVFLGSQVTTKDILAGFRAGADSYMRKPICIEELLLRINNILWRTRGGKVRTSDYFQLGKFTFDTHRQMLFINNKERKLTTKECALLHLLCTHANHIVDRKTALITIWRDESYFSARSMDVYVSKVRKILQDDDSLSIINIHGQGYKLVTHPDNL